MSTKETTEYVAEALSRGEKVTMENEHGQTVELRTDANVPPGYVAVVDPASGETRLWLLEKLFDWGFPS